MRKLLASLFLLFSPIMAQADTATPQDPHLILITTGVIDRTRSPGDKLNDNFTWISTAIATNRNAANSSSSTLSTRIDAVAVSTGNYSSNAHYWSAPQRYGSSVSVQNVLVVDSMTAYGTVTSTGAFNVKITSTDYLSVMQATVTIRGNDYIFQSTAPASNTCLHYSANGVLFWGGCGSGGGSFDATADQYITGKWRFGSSVTVQNALVVDSMTAYGTITSTSGYIGGASTFSEVNVGGAAGISEFTAAIKVGSMTSYGTVTSTSGFIGDGSKLTGVVVGGTTSYGIFNLIISTFGSDTNIIQATATFIDIMGDTYVNFTTQVTMALAPCAGGRDSISSEYASRWYSLWAISNGSNAGMILTEGGHKEPALPSGYTKYRKVGWLYNDASGNLVPFVQTGNVYRWYAQNQILTVGATPATVHTNIDATTAISTDAASCTLRIWGNAGSVGTPKIWINGKNMRTYNASFPHYENGGSGDTFGSVITVPLAPEKPQTLDYITANMGAGELYVNLDEFIMNIP